MDDLVVTGTLGFIGLCCAGVFLLVAICFVVRLVYSSFISGDVRIVLETIIAIITTGSIYLVIGVWLRKTNRI